MKRIILFLSFIFSSNIFAQSDTLSFDNCYLMMQGNVLKVFNNNDQILYQKEFMNPDPYTSDLNDDNINEYLVLDSTLKSNKPWYTLFIFNTKDNFSFIDSIVSGSTQPYETTSGEIGGTIIVAGNPDFEQFNQSDENYFIPINCWHYEDSAVVLVNDEVYNAFLNENESIINYLDDYFSSNSKSCQASVLLKAPVAAAYANYINAGEKSVASQFLKNYYLCDDLDQFKQKLNELIKASQ